MTSDVLLEWMRQIWGQNRDDVQRLLVLDQAPIRKTVAARKALVSKDTDVVFVPGGCTSIVQLDETIQGQPSGDLVKLHSSWGSDAQGQPQEAFSTR